MKYFIQSVPISQIIFGLDDGVNPDGMHVTKCPHCMGKMRDWGSTGDFKGNEWATWKCISTESCGLFEEALPRKTASVIFIDRHKKQMLAVAERVKKHPDTDRSIDISFDSSFFKVEKPTG